MIRKYIETEALSRHLATSIVLDDLRSEIEALGLPEDKQRDVRNLLLDAFEQVIDAVRDGESDAQDDAVASAIDEADERFDARDLEIADEIDAISAEGTLRKVRAGLRALVERLRSDDESNDAPKGSVVSTRKADGAVPSSDHDVVHGGA